MTLETEHIRRVVAAFERHQALVMLWGIGGTRASQRGLRVAEKVKVNLSRLVGPEYFSDQAKWGSTPPVDAVPVDLAR